MTLARARREQLIELASRYGMLLLQDDPYRRIRFSGEPVPPLQSLDRHGCVIGLGTFAQLVAPGLRVGWVPARPEMVTQMAAMKGRRRNMSLHAANAGRVLPRGPYLRLAYSYASPSEIVEGVRRLAVAFAHITPSGRGGFLPSHPNARGENLSDHLGRRVRAVGLFAGARARSRPDLAVIRHAPRRDAPRPARSPALGTGTPLAEAGVPGAHPSRFTG